MKYFYDTEFIEDSQEKLFGKTKPTIDLISIGIVCEDCREYYAISKDFNLKEAWNRYDLKVNRSYPAGTEYIKEYWIRENVLKPIYDDLLFWEYSLDVLYEPINSKNKDILRKSAIVYEKFENCLTDFKRLIKKYGKTNAQISKEIINFCNNDNGIQMYGYYSAYDHVALCWLFGKMINLPKGFPKYTIDLKQMIDDEGERLSFKNYHDFIKTNPTYPKQSNEHNALADAKWNKELYNFIKNDK